MRQLRSEACAAFERAGIPLSISSRGLVDRLPGVDRGTAQRLLRFMRAQDDGLADFNDMPGPRAWRKLTASLEHIATAEPQALEAAVRAFESSIRSIGRSFTDAKRKVASQPSTAETPVDADPSVLWVEAAAAKMGYSVDCRLDLYFARENTAREGRADFAGLQAFVGLRGRADAMPIVVGFRRATPPGPEDSESMPAGWSDFIDAGTSSPRPEMLQAIGEFSHVAILQSDWPKIYDRLNLATVNALPDAGPLPWNDPEKSLRMIMSVTHPTRKLVLDRVVPRTWIDRGRFEFGAFRVSPATMAGAGSPPWYDRLHDSAEVVHHDGIAPAPGGCPHYQEMVAETIDRLDWGSDDLVTCRAEVEFPVPFAEYSLNYIVNPAGS